MYNLIEGEGLNSVGQILIELFLPFLGFEPFYVIFVGLLSDQILAEVQSCIKLSEHLQLPAFFDVLHESGDIAQSLPSLG